MRCMSSPRVTYELTSSYVHNLREWESRKEIAEKGASYVVIDDHRDEQVHTDNCGGRPVAEACQRSEGLVTPRENVPGLVRNLYSCTSG